MELLTQGFIDHDVEPVCGMSPKAFGLWIANLAEDFGKVVVKEHVDTIDHVTVLRVFAGSAVDRIDEL